jgi:hypothetical protein
MKDLIEELWDNGYSEKYVNEHVFNVLGRFFYNEKPDYSSLTEQLNSISIDELKSVHSTVNNYLSYSFEEYELPIDADEALEILEVNQMPNLYLKFIWQSCKRKDSKFF